MPYRALAFLAIFAVANTYGKGTVKESTFGKMPDGKVVTEYTLKNDKGYTAKILNLGAIIKEIRTPDRNGKFGNIGEG